MKTCSQCQIKYPDVLEFCPVDGTPLPVAEGGGTAPKDPLIGTTIDGRYIIESRLGEGGMGVVYKARHAIIDKQVAIKILRKEAAQDDASVKRFLQEARSASKINHSNIVDTTDYGEIAEGEAYGHTYFVMEFLEGPTLAEALSQGPMEPQRVCHIAAQMARGLHAAHQKGIVHRDLKPENVFLIEREGQKDCVKIVDFGIAKVGAGQRLTQVGMVLGTPEYMSPEQATGQETDHRVDQYALGCIMYEMLTGVVPFLGERPAQTLTMHVFEQVLPPRQRKPELSIPTSLEVVVMRTMEKKPDRRFPSMRELEQAITQIEAELRSGRVVVDESRAFSSGPASIRISNPESLPLPPTYPPGYPPPGQPGYQQHPSGASNPGYQSMVGAVPVHYPQGVPPAYAPNVSGGVVVPGYAPMYPQQQQQPMTVPIGGPGQVPGRVGPLRPTLETQAQSGGRKWIAVGIGLILAVVAVVAYELFFNQPVSKPSPPNSPDLLPSGRVVERPVDLAPPIKQPEIIPTPVPQNPTQIDGEVRLFLRSTPPKATVFVNDQKMGVTPMAVPCIRGESYRLELRKTGYHTYSQVVSIGENQDLSIPLVRRTGREPPTPGQNGKSPVSPTPQGPTGLRNPFK